MNGREVLKEGMIWTIGNGDNIKIWKDRWIPRPTSFRPIANVFGGSPDARVVELIDWDSGQWDRTRINETFLPIDAELIPQLRLIDPLVPDKLSWFYSKNGIFTV